MSVSKLSRRALGALAATSLLVGLLPTAATAATPEPRDITKFACPSGEVPDPGFSDDENTTAEHKASIACVVWYELAAGRTTTTYAPGDAVNRGQMATFIGNLLVKGGVTLSDNPPDAFADDDNTQHEKRINQLAELGVVEGDREGKYNAGFPVTRAQMASFLNR
ncbi:MAG: S-layer homology domain-containing protein, partial [Actinobacteria bacterium]|nr:S-layer homology domain-containing protein [Actinomycetota bacterium]